MGTDLADGNHEPEDEPVHDLLVLGILFFPALFAWFLLRPRYSKEIRIGAGIYATAALVALAYFAWRSFF